MYCGLGSWYRWKRGTISANKKYAPIISSSFVISAFLLWLKTLSVRNIFVKNRMRIKTTCAAAEISEKNRAHTTANVKMHIFELYLLCNVIFGWMHSDLTVWCLHISFVRVFFALSLCYAFLICRLYIYFPNFKFECKTLESAHCTPENLCFVVSVFSALSPSCIALISY